jgi:hypothetical protein
MQVMEIIRPNYPLIKILSLHENESVVEIYDVDELSRPFLADTDKVVALLDLNRAGLTK